MVATTTSSTVSATPSIDTGNLAKGLFTDLSPLLALFGDEVTKQFLSMSLGFGDDLLLAIAPIGIITIIVSAIRVGGYPWMKSLIGRARDSPDDEEKELLPSISSSVREIWNGHRVIRQAGESQVVHLIFQERGRSSDGPFLLLSSLQDALDNGPAVVERFKEQRQSSFLRLALSAFKRDQKVRDEESKEKELELIKRLMRKKAPNLTINTPDAITDPMYLWLCVTVGGILQCLVFFFNAYVVYHKHWLRAGAQVAAYGFPLWASGTCSIFVGLFMCAYVIENVTTQYILKLDTPEDVRVVRFQKAIPLMNLPAYGFFKKDSQVLVSQRTTFVGKRSQVLVSQRDTFVGKRSMSDLERSRDITTDVSQRTSSVGSRSMPDSDERDRDITTDLFLQNNNRMAFNTLLGTGFALSGFILQNLGTRELHFSASIAQLLATLALTILRSWVRRNVGIPPPECQELKRGVETTHMISKVCGIKVFTGYAVCSIPRSARGSRSLLRIVANTTPFLEVEYNLYAQLLLNSQRALDRLDLAPGQGRFFFDMAKNAIASVIDLGKDLGFATDNLVIRKLILFHGRTQGSFNTGQKVDLENSEGSIDLVLSLSEDDSSVSRLAALWSFCFYDFHKSESEIGNFSRSIYALHVVAVIKVENDNAQDDYNTKFKLLGDYIGDHNFMGWEVDSDNNLTCLDGVLRNFKVAFPLFGLHFWLKDSRDSPMELQEGDRVITYANSHGLHEHLAADLISSFLVYKRSGSDQQVAESSTTYTTVNSRLRLKNNYFEPLTDKLEGCIEDGDLRLAAIMPAFMHYNRMPPKPSSA